MKSIQTSIPEVILVKPDLDRDAPFAYEWLKSEHGRETLLAMGNVDKEIIDPTLEQQKEIWKSFIDLEKQLQQFTWAIRFNEITIGVVWIELESTFYTDAPAIHIMIGDKNYRRKGIGKIAFNAMIQYTKRNLHERRVYSRYLISNNSVRGLLESIGFQNDGSPYFDDNNLEWQNVKLNIYDSI